MKKPPRGEAFSYIVIQKERFFDACCGVVNGILRSVKQPCNRQAFVINCIHILNVRGMYMEQNDQNKESGCIGRFFLGMGLLFFVLGAIFLLIFIVLNNDMFFLPIMFMALGGLFIQIGAILLWFLRKCADTEPFGEVEASKTPISYHVDVSGSYNLKTGEGDVRVALLCGLLFLVIGLDLLIAAICIMLFSDREFITVWFFWPIVLCLFGIPFAIVGVKGLRAWQKAKKGASEDGRS